MGPDLLSGMGAARESAGGTVKKERGSRHYEMTELLRCTASSANREYQQRDAQVYTNPSPTTSKRWFGVEGGIPAVEKLVHDGWPEGLQRIQEAVQALAPKGVASIRRRRVRRDFGDDVDMQRVYSGDLGHAWSATERVLKRGLGRHVTTILINLGQNARATGEQMFWRGAAAVSLVNALEESGRRVRVVGFDTSQRLYAGEDSETVTVFTVTLKEAREPVDLENLAVATALSGFFRVYLFRAWWAIPEKVKSSLGHALVWSRRDGVKTTGLQSLMDQAGTEATIMVDGIWSKLEAQEFVSDWCRRISG